MVTVNDRPKSAGTGGGPARGTIRRYIPELEGLRGLAAVGVLVTHVAFSAGAVAWNEYPGFEQAGHGLVSGLLQQLHVFLPVFFVLSGALLYRPFVLSTLADVKKPALKPYLWRRALRILPSYWAVLTVALLVFDQLNVKDTWGVIRSYLLLQVYQENSWVSGLEQGWSLSTEIAFYLGLPLVALLFTKLAGGAPTPGARARRILTMLIIPVGIGLAWTFYTHGAGMGPYPMENEWPITWFGFLAGGMMLATLSALAEVAPEEMPRPYRWITEHPLAVWTGALAVYLFLAFSPVGDPQSANYPPLAQGMVEHSGYLLFGLLIVAPLTGPAIHSKGITAVLANPVATYLGRISVGMYLWHIPIITYYTGDLAGGDVGFGELLLVVCGLSIAFATASYYLIERPALSLREKLGKASRQPGVTVVEERVAAAK